MSNICIRPAQLSDHDQLLCFRQALWPKSSAEEHARELTLILEGKAVTTLPFIIFVTEASDRTLAGFLEIDLRSHADGCDPLRPSATSRVGTLLRSIDTRESGRNSWPRQKTGRAARGALRWRQILGSTMKCPNACTRRWGTRWWTAVCITVKHCDMHSDLRAAFTNQPLAITTVVQELLSLGRSRFAAMPISSRRCSPRMIGQ